MRLGLCEVDLHIAEAELKDLGKILLLHAAQQRLDPSQQLRWIERLGQIIVGAQFQPNNTVDYLRLGSKHQDGHVESSLPDLAAHVKAILTRQHDVENNDVECSGDRLG